MECQGGSHITDVFWDRQTADDAVPASSLATQLNLGQDMSLAARSSVAIPGGHHVVRQQQMFRGVPVCGRSIAVVQDDQGKALRASGALMQTAQLNLASVAPKLNATLAQAALRAHAHTLLLNSAPLSNQMTDLFVYPQDDRTVRLVYRVSYFVGGTNPSRPTAIIDANTGTVIQSWDGLTDATATGPGGNQKTGQYGYAPVTPHFRSPSPAAPARWSSPT